MSPFGDGIMSMQRKHGSKFQEIFDLAELKFDILLCQVGMGDRSTTWQLDCQVQYKFPHALYMAWISQNDQCCADNYEVSIITASQPGSLVIISLTLQRIGEVFSSTQSCLLSVILSVFRTRQEMQNKQSNPFGLVGSYFGQQAFHHLFHLHSMAI